MLLLPWMLFQAKLFCFCVAEDIAVDVAAGVVSVVDALQAYFSVFVKWCLHCGVNRCKLGPF
jgi:hypothetical protein